MRLWKKIRDLKERMHFKTSFVIELSIIIGCLTYLLFYILCLMQADNISHYWKACYDLCINIGAATALTFMFENISVRSSRRQQALAILRMNSYLQDYISIFCRRYMELTYEDKNKFISDVKVLDFVNRGGIDHVIGRRISGKSMQLAFIPSMILGSGYSKTALEVMAECEKNLIEKITTCSLHVDFSNWPKLYESIRLILHSSAIFDCISEMKSISHHYCRDPNYKSIVNSQLSTGVFDQQVKEPEIIGGNVMTPYVAIYKHFEWLLCTLCDYENNIQKIKEAYPDLI